MKKNLFNFFVYTILISWILWLPTVLNAQYQEMPAILLIIGMFAGFVPSIIGLIMLKKEKGIEFRIYLKNKLSFSFSKKWLIAMFIFPLHGVVAFYLTRIIDSNFETVNPISIEMVAIIFVQILVIGGALGEELGWRGYALPKLETIYGWFIGTLLLGILWSFWHLPLFFMTGTVQSNIPLWQFMLQNIVITYFYTWIYNNTRGNLILMILLHGIMNTSAAVFPYWQSNIGRYIGIFLFLIILIIIKIIDRTIYNFNYSTDEF